MNFRRMMAIAVVAAGGIWAVGAQAEETVMWWDFLGGGDGVRMKQMIADFNAAHTGKIKIDSTTLEWGTPFYSKVQTSAAVGEALSGGGIRADRVRVRAEARRERPAVPLSLEGRPHLQTIRVGRPDLAAYRELLPAEEVHR